MGNSSAEIVASIDDMVIEILSRFPIRQFVRSKLVSKHWHYLITDLSRRRRRAKPNPPVGIFVRNTKYYHYEYISFFPHENSKAKRPTLNFELTVHPHNHGILAYCNGLMLCFLRSACAHHPLNTHTYYVYNPTTNQSSVIPNTIYWYISCDECREYGAMILAFDPVKSPHYIVVCVKPPCEYHGYQKKYGKSKHQILVYSSKYMSWFTASETDREAYFRSGVFWNGAIHWISGDPSQSSFRFIVDEYTLVDMPTPSVPSYRGSPYGGHSNDHLHFIFETPGHLEVYEMKKDYSEWFLKYKVDFSTVPGLPQIMRDNPLEALGSLYYSILCLVEGDKAEDSFLVFSFLDEVVKYNIVHKNCEHLYKFEDPEAHVGCLGIEYIESLCDC